MVPEQRLKFFCQLIAEHGKKEIFLKVFRTIVDTVPDDSVDVHKKVLFVLLNEQYANDINPFKVKPRRSEFESRKSLFPEDKDPFVYTSTLLYILSKCMESEVGVSLISKAFKMFQIKDLISLLLERTKQEREMIHHKKEADLLMSIEIAKSSTIEIILIFSQSSNHVIDELPNCAKELFDYIELESERINSKDY